jgi:zinc and cadmium transporter
MGVWIPTLLAVGCVSLLGLLGGFTLQFRSLARHSVLTTLVALAVGALLGDAFLHILPDAAASWGGFTPQLGLMVLAGFLPFFVMEAFLRWEHTHGTHAHGPGEHEEAAAGRVAPFGWMNLVGSGVHNLLDGVVIAAAFQVSQPLGLSTALAVGLHEIPHELGDFAVLVKAGFPPRRALLYNFLSACVATLGAVGFLLLPFPPAALDKIALPLTAGGFVYIAAADLVPELHHHGGDRRQTALIFMGVLAGLAAMLGILALE